MALFGGNAPGGRSWQDTLAILGAMLQDTGAAYNGRPGNAVNSVRNEFKRIGDQQKYQDSLKSAFGSPEINPVMNTPSVMSGQPIDKVALADSDRQGMMFSGPTGQALGYDQSAAMLPMLQNMDPQTGLPVLLNAMGQAGERRDRRYDRQQDRDWQVEDRTQARAQTVQDNAVRPATSEEKKRFGFSEQTPLFVDGFGKPIPLQDPNAITPYQRAQLGLEQQQLAISRQNANKGAAPPSGYMPNPNGNGLTFIPGGPADPAVAGRGTGKPTEDQAKNAQLYTRAAAQLPIALENFDALGGKLNQLGNAIGFGTPIFTGEAYERAKNSVADIVQTYIYSTSGASAPEGEVERNINGVTPKIGDSPKTLADKKRRLEDMVNSIKLRASPQSLGSQQQPANSGGWGIRKLP